MCNSKVRIENGLVVGTSGTKYSTKNPIAQWLVSGFDKAITGALENVSPSLIVEIGCGEGHVTNLLLEKTTAGIHATDVSAALLDETKCRFVSSRITWEIARLETFETDLQPDMVVCCEVLEHLPDPRRGMEVLAGLRAQWYLLSVPREPLWRSLNFLRGAYLEDLGNSPGHIQHWSKRGFVKFAAEFFDVKTVRTPLPWTVLLCKGRLN